ncbi:MAG TPA: hypothetical protein VGQ57_04230 [Polyangiaceae bacterium]|jgi:hypothetical protein|nr:hypothetical protein [Polyangiaceae bacterium]
MVGPDELALRGLRAYEAGRFLAALRVALVVIPVAALCLLERTARGQCACLAGLLLTAAVFFRWRHRRGLEAVTTGLLAGAVPLVVGLALARLGLRCGSAGTASFCTGLSLAIGAAGGLVISGREQRLGARVSGLFTAGIVAALAAGLGCVRLGIWGTASMTLGIVLGTFAGAPWRRPPPRGGSPRSP